MKYDWSEERVASAVKKANCWYECLALLGIPKAGCNYRTLKGKVASYGLDTSHFNYDYAHIHNGKHYKRQISNRPDSEIFCENARIKVDNLKKEYIRRVMNGDARCENCGIREWNGKALTFQIHHIDGNHSNHTISNLILLCPNCHSQTENYSNKKR